MRRPQQQAPWEVHLRQQSGPAETKESAPKVWNVIDVHNEVELRSESWDRSTIARRRNVLQGRQLSRGRSGATDERLGLGPFEADDSD